MTSTTPTKSSRQQLTRKLAAWALGHEERRRFADLVSRHRYAQEEQEAATDWIYLRAELLTRQQHPELIRERRPRENWSRAHERTFHAWVQALHGEVADELRELRVEEWGESVVRYASHLGFRSHIDLIDALGLNKPGDELAANEA